jgi:hypothetical protein
MLVAGFGPANNRLEPLRLGALLEGEAQVPVGAPSECNQIARVRLDHAALENPPVGGAESERAGCMMDIKSEILLHCRDVQVPVPCCRVLSVNSSGSEKRAFNVC